MKKIILKLADLLRTRRQPGGAEIGAYAVLMTDGTCNDLRDLGDGPLVPMAR